MKKIVLLIMMVMLSSIAMAAEDEMTTQLQTLTTQVEGLSVPAPFSTLLGDQTINLHIDRETQDNITLGILTIDGVVNQTQVGLYDDPTLRVYASEEVLAGIEESENPFIYLQETIDAQELEYEAEGFLNKIRFRMLGFFLDIAAQRNAQ